MSQLIICGAGEIAELAHFYFTKEEKLKVAAFTVDDEYVKEKQFCGLPVVPFSEVAKKFPATNHKGFVAISYNQMNRVRERKFNDFTDLKYDLVSYISPKCTNYAASIGKNCFIFEDNTLQPFSKIGNNVTLWSGNHIGHHSVIEDHCFITSHVVVSGGVTVRHNAFLGVNVTLRDHIEIGAYALVGAGAVIVDNIPERSVSIGTKAKITDKDSWDVKI